MKNDSGKFLIEMPGFFRSAFYAVRSPSNFPIGLEAWVTDHESGERFQLSEDEAHMVMVLGENLGDLEDKHHTHFFSSRVWPVEHQDPVLDHVLTAIVNKRKGDTSEWEHLKAMTVDQWYEWLEDQLVREKP